MLLKELKVIDLSTVLAGPSVGMFFAELGAEVIKIEHPDHPDVTRSWKLPSENKTDPVSAYFSSINYKKTYTSINLKVKEDKTKLIELVRDADVLLMNFKKGDQEKFQLPDSLLHDINPRLIIGKINGFGANSDRVAFDLILQAESGFMSMNGQKDSPPTKMPVALIDVLAGHQLKEGILTSLLERTTTGKGKVVTVSLLESAISALVNQASNYLMAGKVAQRIGSKHPNIAPYGELFETKDGKLITFAIGSNTHFKKLCALFNLDELVDSPEFSTNTLRVENRNELEKIIAEKVNQFDSDFILKNLHSNFVPVGVVKNLKEVFEGDTAKKMVREEVIDNITTQRVSSIAFKTNYGD